MTEKEGETEARNSPFVGLLFRWSQQQGLNRAEAGTLDLHLGVGWLGPKPVSHLLLPSQGIRWELDQKHSPWDSNKWSDTGCCCHMWQFSPLCHTSGPRETGF